MESTSGQDTPISSAKPLKIISFFLLQYLASPNFRGQLVEGKPGRGYAGVFFFYDVRLPLQIISFNLKSRIAFVSGGGWH